jgi:tetratricopeptide (TPR) repeat protein
MRLPARSAIAGLLLLVACSNPERQKNAHLERGRGYLDAGKTEEALLEFRNVVQLDARDPRGRFQLALALLNKGDPASQREAQHHLHIVVQEKPDHLEAHLKLSEIALTADEKAKAREHAAAALRLAPNDPPAQLMQGRVLLSLRQHREAVAVLRKAVAADESSADARVYLARALALRQQRDAAKKELDRALSLDGKSSTVFFAIGDFHFSQSENEAAENAYRQALKLAPDSAAIRMRLSGLLRSQGKWREAAKLFEESARAKPSDPTPHIALGTLYADQGEFDRATKHLRQALELDPDSMRALDRLLEVELRRGNVQGVEKEVQKLLDQNAQHPMGQYYQARLALDRREYEDAIGQLRQLAKQHPDLGAVHLTLGQALAAAGDRQGATRALQQATSVEAVAAEAFLALAKLHLAENAANLAVLEARQALDRRPGYLPALVVHAEALTRSKRFSEARDVLVEATNERPKDPALSLALGRLARLQKKPAKALAHFDQALQLEPKFEPALREITKTYLSQGKHDEARQRVEQQLKAVPDSTGYQTLLGQALQAGGKLPQAEAAYEKAMRSSKLASNAYAKLAALYLKQKREKEAIERYTAELAENPKQIGPNVIVGILSHVTGDPARAKAHYEAALALNPREAISANNLAGLLSVEGKDLDRALKLAESAYRERPGDASVLDTIGWIYYQKKNFRQAASLLNTAHRLQPRDPVLAFHYGMALAQLPDHRAEARTILQRLLEKTPDYPDATQAKATLEKLKPVE